MYFNSILSMVLFTSITLISPFALADEKSCASRIAAVSARNRHVQINADDPIYETYKSGLIEPAKKAYVKKIGGKKSDLKLASITKYYLSSSTKGYIIDVDNKSDDEGSASFTFDGYMRLLVIDIKGQSPYSIYICEE